MDKDFNKKLEEALKLIKENDDEEGLELLFSLMSPAMKRIAKTIINSDFLLDDVLQESFIKIVQNIDSYKKNTNPYSWILQITKNTALNFLKSENPNRYEDFSDYEIFIGEEDLKIKDEASKLVEDIFNNIENKDIKKMLYLKYFLDLSVREIAKEMNISKSQVDRLIKDEEKKIKEKYKF